ARSRMIRGDVQYNKMSRFIREIPTELLDTGRKSGSMAFGAAGSSGAGSGFSSSGRKGTGSGRADRQPVSALQKGSDLRAEKTDKLAYGVGDRVRHVKFGEGTVLDIKEGGRDFEVTVEFDNAGVRKMFAMFAKLTKIG